DPAEHREPARETDSRGQVRRERPDTRRIPQWRDAVREGRGEVRSKSSGALTDCRNPGRIRAFWTGSRLVELMFVADSKRLTLAGGPARWTAMEGGCPVIVDGECIGGVGVSGGDWATDERIARESVEAIGAKPK